MIRRWLNTFHNDPKKAVNDLFSGRAGLGSSMRLDIPELLYQEFPPLPEFQDARQLLDRALFVWLVAMRKDYARQVNRLGFAVYSKRLCDCLIATQLLELKMFPYKLRQGLDSWLHWMTPLRIAPERDPALECRRLLARYQKDAEHTSAWLRLAGDGRPEYLDVALLGLQCRPTNHDTQNNQVLMLLALLIHESVCCTNGPEANAHFKRRFAALRGLYPRGPRYWQKNLENALDLFKNRARTKVAKELHQIMSEKRAKGTGREKPKVFPVPKHKFDALLRDLKCKPQQDAGRLAEQFITNQKQNLRFAEQTGNSFFFIRTLSKQGNLLLKRYILSPDVMGQIGQLIEQGLAWEPYNPYIWMIWAKWCAKKKQLQQLEWILRESVRLFPDQEPNRVELARLLIDRSEEHWDEAEQWLREAAERNPNNEHSRVELARLLINRGEEHWDEAERWLWEAAGRNPNNEHSRVELARLLIDRGEEHWDEAEQWLREAAERNPNNEPSRVELARLLINRGEEHWDEAERWLREAAGRDPNNEPSRVELARLLTNRGEEHWDEAERWLREAAGRNPNNEHSRVELARLLINMGKEHWDEA
ncbi:MAG TPA: tetratricopeptide repeat protein, partial [Gammaproteobacteria bacterium]|nr:tetratricopeptide repeat protein [Gammaproteobacteria bacterium]